MRTLFWRLTVPFVGLLALTVATAGPIVAQQIVVLHGLNAGLAKPLTVTAGGNLNVTGVGPVDATYITQTANATLTAEQALGALATGILSSTTVTGVVASNSTSASIAALISDETGTGAMVFGTSPNFTTSITFGGTSGLFDDAANVLAQRNGTNAQTFRLYKTFTDAANYERFLVGLNGTDFNVTSGAAGTGTVRNIQIVGAWSFSPTTGFMTTTTDNAYDIGASGATRPRTGYFGTSVVSPVYALGAAGGTLAISSTAPTISSGFGTTPSIAANNGTIAFTINVGTGGTASSGVIGLPTATTGWVCQVDNRTAVAANRADQRTVQTATATTTATVQNQTISTGAALAWTASDILSVSCTAY